MSAADRNGEGAPLRTRVTRLWKGAFLRDVLKVGGGGVTGQALIVAASPLLSRLFSPEEFGAYAIYLSIVTVVGTVACLRFDVAIPIPKSEPIALALARLAALSLVVTAVATAVVGAVLVATGPLRPLLGLGPWPAALLFLAGVFGYGGYLLLSNWAVRRGAYGLLGATRFTRAVAQVVMQLGLGVLGVASSGLVVGHALGHLFGQLALGRDLLERSRARRPKAGRLRWAARRYRKYAVFSAPAALVNSLGMQLPPIVLAAFFGPAVAGLYAVAQRVIGTPAGIVGSAISQVFFGRTVELLRNDPTRLRAAFLRTLAWSAAIGILPLALIAMGGPELFALVFGESWRGAGRMVQVLVPMFLLQFAIYPVSLTLNAIGRPDLQLAYDVLRLGLGVGTLLVFGKLGAEPLSALAGYSAGMSLAYIIYAVIAHRALVSLTRGR